MASRFGLIFLSVGTTAAAIALFQSVLGFAPLILFVVPIVAFVHVAGMKAGLIVAISAALAGDYCFVEPVRAVTIHTQGLRLLVFLLMGLGFSWVVSTRPFPRRGRS
jgi:K+-sensing histidine kinase KdpD